MNTLQRLCDNSQKLSPAVTVMLQRVNRLFYKRVALWLSFSKNILQSSFQRWCALIVAAPTFLFDQSHNRSMPWSDSLPDRGFKTTRGWVQM